MALFFGDRILFWTVTISVFLKTQKNVPIFQLLQVFAFVFVFVFFCISRVETAVILPFLRMAFKTVAAAGGLNCKETRRIRLPCYGTLNLPPPISCREASLKRQTEENFV